MAVSRCPNLSPLRQLLSSRKHLSPQIVSECKKLCTAVKTFQPQGVAITLPNSKPDLFSHSVPGGFCFFSNSPRRLPLKTGDRAIIGEVSDTSPPCFTTSTKPPRYALTPETKGALRAIARQQGKTTHGLMISVLRAYAQRHCRQNKSPTAA